MAQRQVGIVLDPLDSLVVAKDSTIAIIEELQKRNFQIVVFEPKDLYALSGKAFGHGKIITVDVSANPYYKITGQNVFSLDDFDAIFMRKDPPYNEEYIHTTHILDLTTARVINSPAALRYFNEKASLHLFPDITPPTLMTKSIIEIKNFIKLHKKIVIKPLNLMGGRSVFVVDEKDSNANVIVETMTQMGQKTILAQKYLSEITKGDQRILIFAGKPIEFQLVRKPSLDDHRGNLVAGASYDVIPLRPSQIKICEKLAPFFQKHTIDIVGLDMIGDYVTEINITSPTGFREIGKGASIDVLSILINNLNLSTM
ncbi:MAG: glutathione synthase [Bdellovibrionales bacterium]|nr:glutathione synthase [Bdellovibrionales bacterium]